MEAGKKQFMAECSAPLMRLAAAQPDCKRVCGEKAHLGGRLTATLRWFGCGKCGDFPQGGTGIALTIWPCEFMILSEYNRLCD